MNIVTIDFETYYDGKIGLGFKTQTTEEYIRDPRFEVIGVGVKINGDPSVWATGSKDRIKKFLDSFDLQNHTVLCHNTLFDGAILSWFFDIRPAFLLDTLSMARALCGVDVGNSLATLAERYKLGKKGDEVIKAEGKRQTDFTSEELADYGRYCCNDVDLTYALFNKLHAEFPEDEYALVDMTLRMFTEPSLRVDDALLNIKLVELQQEKTKILQGLKNSLRCDTEEEVRKRLASNKQFAIILESMNIDVPMKLSPTTGKLIPALAKNDDGFIELTTHPNPAVQHLCAVRLGTKSTLEESRIQRFIDIGARNKGYIPVPLKYYGAHTGRWSGMDKINFQNLPSRDRKKKTLKNAILPVEGKLIINADSSQIEARVLAWLSGQRSLVELFLKGEDVYCDFASTVYNRKITKDNPVERFVGKTCILGLGYGTGATKLQMTLKNTPPGASLSHTICTDIVNLYRSVNANIPALWKAGDRLLQDLVGWGPKDEEYPFGDHFCVWVTKDGIRLPNGLKIKYPELNRYPDPRDLSKSSMQYKSRRGMVNIWGGMVVENVVQALAKIIVGEQMLRIGQRYRVALTVHDAAVVTVPKEEIDEATAYIRECMSTVPEWARPKDGGRVWMRLPITCDVKYGDSYGECG
jgi:DNA polymerase I-like protein with 3'-5' exonuclease and polymerase domains